MKRRSLICSLKSEITFAIIFNQYIKTSSVLKHKSNIMLGNESGASDREKNHSLMRSNNDQGQRSKEVSLKVGEILKEHL